MRFLVMPIGRFFLTSGLVLVLSSCAKLQYLDQALALKAYAQERAAQDAEVSWRDARFEKLLSEVRSGEAQASLRTAAELESQFGEPVLKLPVQGSSSEQEWLYRYQIRHDHVPKVYVRVSKGGEITGFRVQ